MSIHEQYEDLSREQFTKGPRDYALALVESEIVDKGYMLMAMIKAMGHAELQIMLTVNELDPERLFDDEDEEE